jgi:hypothetical protein
MFLRVWITLGAINSFVNSCFSAKKSAQELQIRVKTCQLHTGYDESGGNCVDWIHLAQDKDQWHSHDHCNKPLGSTQCGKFFD